MQSGIGDQEQLRRFGIPLVQHLPGTGQNRHDHVNLNCVWEDEKPVPPCNNRGGTVVYWKSDPSLEAPDTIHSQLKHPAPTPQTATFDIPEHAWSMFAGIVRPQSRGSVSLTGANSIVRYTSRPAHLPILPTSRLPWRQSSYAGRSVMLSRRTA